MPASVIEWRIGDGTAGDSENRFFLDLYNNVAEMLREDDRFLQSRQLSFPSALPRAR